MNVETSRLFYLQDISIDRFSREDINVDLKTGSGGRITVLVTDLTDELDYTIYRQ